jgi:chromosome segregation protein
LNLLQSWHDGLDEYGDGVRAILQTTESERPPVLDVLARLIQPAAGYEAAIEAALGPFLRALVVASSSDAFACGRWLRERQAGYALIVWVIEQPAAHLSRTAPAAVQDGLQPLAAFVTSQPTLRPLIERLLRNMFVVDALDTTRHVSADVAPMGAVAASGLQQVPTITVVTPHGELLHRDGWLRGGATPIVEHAPGSRPDAPASTLLVHERELRELPATIEHLSREIRDLQVNRARATSLQSERQLALAAYEQDVRGAETRAQEFARQVATLQREEERAQSDLRLSQAIAEQLTAEMAGIEQEIEATTVRVSEQETRQRDASDAARTVQEFVDELVARNRNQQEELARQRTMLAVQRQEVKTLLQQGEQTQAQLNELVLQIERRAARIQTIVDQQAGIDQTTADQQESLGALRTQLRESTVAMGETEAALAHAEGMLAQFDRDQAGARQQLAAAETDYRRTMIEAQRASDALEALVGQIREELIELGELTPESNADDVVRRFDQGADHRTTESSDEPQLPRGNDAPLADPHKQDEAAKMRRQIEGLRNRLRQLGGFDPDAPQAYEELRTRHEFLTTQVRDMEQGAANLRSIIVELDTTMRRQFAETFAAVNLRFQRHFTALFSGGAARLELTAPRRQSMDDEDQETAAHASTAKGVGVGGIEVFVQIPGKRVQDLSLLSGGERAMVSVALLFALLETNPPPFCLLDEVDAALDEANVVRFCEILHQLAESTQFIVITHNRVTMTHASAIYGVSMGADSVSRILSMRLAEVSAPR